MTLSKIDSGPKGNTAISRSRAFKGFSPNSGTLMIMRKTSPFNELRICLTVSFAVHHHLAHTSTLLLTLLPDQSARSQRPQ